jgi:hypothetical protein
MGTRAQRIPSWPGVIHSNKGRIHLRRPTCDITFRLRQSGGPYIPVGIIAGNMTLTPGTKLGPYQISAASLLAAWARYIARAMRGWEVM